MFVHNVIFSTTKSIKLTFFVLFRKNDLPPVLHELSLFKGYFTLMSDRG